MDEHVDERIAPGCKHDPRARYHARIANRCGDDDEGFKQMVNLWTAPYRAKPTATKRARKRRKG